LRLTAWRKLRRVQIMNTAKKAQHKELVIAEYVKGKFCVIEKETGISIAHGLNKASARLIASAPELLAACETVLNHISQEKGRNDPDNYKLNCMLLKVITKAKGE
jgi:hypothetical protein